MRAVLFFLIIFFSLSSGAFAQSSPQIRRLPPSLERELKLKHGGAIRIVGFVDTLKAQNIIANSIRDSSTEELDSQTVRDSAIIIVDSSVSLTDKEWLDSMLTQLPEYKMTPEGIRFYYPADILIETNRKVVPPDTTLASRMDPVTKEDLPLYDAFPMPRPLRQLSLPRTSIEFGAGSPYLPLIDVSSLVLSNDRSAVELDGKFKSTAANEPAIKQFWKIGASGSFVFPDASQPPGEQTPELDIGAATGANYRQLYSTIDSGRHTLSQTNFGAGFTIGESQQLKLISNAVLCFLNDDIGNGLSETGSALSLSLLKDLSGSSYRLGFDAGFQEASSIGPVVFPLLITTGLYIQQRENDPFQWKAGLSYLAGNDARGSTSSIFPTLSLKTHISHALEIGAGFEPENTLIDLRTLYAKNLFIAPEIRTSTGDSLVGGDPRRVVTEPIHINVFAKYFLTSSDELHGEFHFMERNNEPVFYRDSARGFFYTTPQNTSRFEFEAGGSKTLFTKDIFRASILFRVATLRSDGAALPYEPTAKIQAAYQFGNISEKFIPKIEFIDLQRPNHTFTFINLDAKYIFSPAFLLKFRAENIFGSTGDFWTGYDESPRAVWVSAEYRF